MNTRVVKNILKTVAVPVVAFIVIDLICMLAQGRHLFASTLDVRNYLRASCISFTSALALSFNLSCGRFDLSLGAQRLMAVIVGGGIAMNLGLGLAGALLFAVLFGILSGMLVGALTVIFKLPALILGIAMTLIYECICFTLRVDGIQFYGVSALEPLSGLVYPISISVAVVVIVSLLLQYTRFGYALRAISCSERISKGAGLNVAANTLGCYALGGGVVAVSGVFDAAYRGRMQTVIGFSSSTPILTNCFPVFLGQYMSKWTNLPVATFFAALAVKLFTTGLAVMKFSASLQQALELSLFLVYLIFDSNQGLIAANRARRARLELAERELAADAHE